MTTIPLPPLSKPAIRALNAQGYFSLQDTQKVSAEALLHLHDVGPKTVRQLRAAFKTHNLPNRLSE